MWLLGILVPHGAVCAVCNLLFLHTVHYTRFVPQTLSQQSNKPMNVTLKTHFSIWETRPQPLSALVSQIVFWKSKPIVLLEIFQNYYFFAKFIKIFLANNSSAQPYIFPPLKANIECEFSNLFP